MVEPEGYRVYQGVGARTHSPGQFAGLFAVYEGNFHATLGEIAGQRMRAAMGNGDAPALLNKLDCDRSADLPRSAQDERMPRHRALPTRCPINSIGRSWF